MTDYRVLRFRLYGILHDLDEIKEEGYPEHIKEHIETIEQATKDAIRELIEND